MSDDSNKVYRESCKRNHRIIANYLAVRAWWRGADCVMLSKDVLYKMLDVSALKEQRLKWFQDDVKKWFPYSQVARDIDTNAAKSLYLSRVKIPADRFSGTGNQSALIKFRDAGKYDFSESAMITELTLFASGLKVPEAKRPLPKKQ